MKDLLHSKECNDTGWPKTVTFHKVVHTTRTHTLHRNLTNLAYLASTRIAYFQRYSHYKPVSAVEYCFPLALFTHHS